MLQSWNKFCFSSGYIEVAVNLPGPDENTRGYVSFLFSFFFLFCCLFAFFPCWRRVVDCLDGVVRGLEPRIAGAAERHISDRWKACRETGTGLSLFYGCFSARRLMYASIAVGMVFRKTFCFSRAVGQLSPTCALRIQRNLSWSLVLFFL